MTSTGIVEIALRRRQFAKMSQDDIDAFWLQRTQYSRQELDQGGIYLITNTATAHAYVGRTQKSFQARWWGHMYSLRRNTHYNQELQRAWREYGEDCFTFSILEVVPQDTPLRVWCEREKHHINTAPYPLYNRMRDLWCY